MLNYLNKDGVQTLWNTIKNTFALKAHSHADYVSNVSYDSTSKKIQQTKNNTASDVVTLADVATSGSYDDLADKPTIPTPASKSTAIPLMDGTASAGTSVEYASGDHRHPTDTSRVSTTRTVNGKALSSNIVLGAEDILRANSTTTVEDSLTSVTSQLETKVDKVSGKGLSTNDYTSEEKTKLQGIATNATRTVISSDTKVISFTINNVRYASAIDASQKGVASGICPLDANRKVASSYLPTYVESVGFDDATNIITKTIGGSVSDVVQLADVAITGDYGDLLSLPTLDALNIPYEEGQTDSIADAIDARIATRVPLSSVGIGGGVCPLNVSTKIDPVYLTEATTTDAGAMSVSDKTKLDKLIFDANDKIDSSILPGSSVAPATATPIMDGDSGVVGLSNKYAREDHVHPLNIPIDTTASTGTTDGDLYAAITALSWANDVIG